MKSHHFNNITKNILLHKKRKLSKYNNINNTCNNKEFLISKKIKEYKKFKILKYSHSKKGEFKKNLKDKYSNVKKLKNNNYDIQYSICNNFNLSYFNFNNFYKPICVICKNLLNSNLDNNNKANFYCLQCGDYVHFSCMKLFSSKSNKLNKCDNIVRNITENNNHTNNLNTDLDDFYITDNIELYDISYNSVQESFVIFFNNTDQIRISNNSYSEESSISTNTEVFNCPNCFQVDTYVFKYNKYKNRDNNHKYNKLYNVFFENIELYKSECFLFLSLNVLFFILKLWIIHKMFTYFKL